MWRNEPVSSWLFRASRKNGEVGTELKPAPQQGVLQYVWLETKQQQSETTMKDPNRIYTVEADPQQQIVIAIIILL